MTVFNSSGAVQWARNWGGAANDFGNAVTVDASGTWYVTGEAESLGYGTEGGSIVSIDSSGNYLWNETWSGTGSDLGRDIIIASDGDILLTGEFDSFGAGSDDFFLLRRDPNIDLCGGICLPETISLTNIATTENDQAVTEADQTVTEVDETVTEADQTATFTLVNEVTVADAGTGTPLAAENTDYTLVRGDEPVRLRALVRTSSPKNANASSVTLKLQYAKMIGTCDTSFTGESYADISSTSRVAFYDNPSIFDGAALGLYDNDPTSGNDTVIAQSYEESNNFTNRTALNAANRAYLWDFAITPSDAINGTYCIRAVNSDGSLLSAYSQIYTLSFPSGTSQQMRHGSFFDAETEGTKQAFYW